MAVKKSKKKSSKRSVKERRGKGRRSGFQYRARSNEEYRRKAEESSGNFDAYIKDGIPKFKPHDGANRVRILPPTWDGADDFAYTLLVHYDIGADEQTYLCRKMLGEDCAICDEAHRLTQDGESEDAANFKSKKRKIAWLIDRKGEDDGPSVWPMPFGTWKDITLACKDEEGEILALDHPEEGNDVSFTKEGQGRRTKYIGVKLGKQRPILQDEDDVAKVLDFIQENPLNDILVFYDNDYLQAVLEGKKVKDDDDDDDEDDDDDQPRRKKSKKKPNTKKSKKRSRDEDDDEDDDEDEEDEDEEDEDDEEDDDEDDDEEDEPKRKKGKSGGSASTKLKNAAKRAKSKSSSKKKRR